MYRSINFVMLLILLNLYPFDKVIFIFYYPVVLFLEKNYVFKLLYRSITFSSFAFAFGLTDYCYKLFRIVRIVKFSIRKTEDIHNIYTGDQNK